MSKWCINLRVTKAESFLFAQKTKLVLCMWVNFHKAQIKNRVNFCKRITKTELIFSKLIFKEKKEWCCTTSKNQAPCSKLHSLNNYYAAIFYFVINKWSNYIALLRKCFSNKPKYYAQKYLFNCFIVVFHHKFSLKSLVHCCSHKYGTHP